MFSFNEVLTDYLNYTAHSEELKKINLDKYTTLTQNKSIKSKFETKYFDKISIEFDSVLNSSGECVVNAANEGLLGGGGIDGAIHQACGSELKKYIIQNIPANIHGARIYEGQAVITPGFLSKFKWIIHTVAPYYDEQNRMKIDVMKNAFDSIFKLIDENNIEEIILTPIGTGFYGFHMYEFTLILFEKIAYYLEKNKKIKKVRIMTNLKLMYNYFTFYFNSIY